MLMNDEGVWKLQKMGIFLEYPQQSKIIEVNVAEV